MRGVREPPAIPENGAVLDELRHDLIIVLERGRLVEQRSHEELLKRQGIYYYLVGQQLGV